MSALRERLLHMPLRDLAAAAERGEIAADEVWDEVLASLDRSADLLRDMSRARQETIDFLDRRLPELVERQDRCDDRGVGLRG